MSKARTRSLPKSAAPRGKPTKPLDAGGAGGWWLCQMKGIPSGAAAIPFHPTVITNLYLSAVIKIDGIVFVVKDYTTDPERVLEWVEGGGAVKKSLESMYARILAIARSIEDGKCADLKLGIDPVGCQTGDGDKP